MARLSVNETTTFRWSFEEDVIRYAEAGIPSMGVWRHKLSDFGVAKGVEFLAEHAVEASHLFWVGGFTGSDGRSFRESVEDAQEAIREAAELQAGSLVLYSGARGCHTARAPRGSQRCAHARIPGGVAPVPVKTLQLNLTPGLAQSQV